MSRHELLRGLQMSMLWRRHLPVLLAVSCGVAFSVAVFFVVRWWESRDINAAFQSVAADRAFEVKNTFETEIGMLELFRAALMTDGKVEKDEFREILQPFHSHDKSIESVQWIPRVSNGQRREFELAAQHNGFPGYRITEPDKNGQMMPAKQRSEYFPIYFAYFAGSRPASKEIWGYDVGSEPTRLEALCQARDSGKLVASGRIRFVRDPTEAGGFLVCVPVYEKDKPTKTLADRRKYLMGFILGVFRPSDMLDVALAPMKPEGIDVGLFDASAPATEHHQDFHASRVRADRFTPIDLNALHDDETPHYTIRLDVAGHPWTVACLPMPTFFADRRTLWPWGVLTIGLAFTVMLAAYLWLSVNQQKYLAQKVLEQTVDIRRANEEVIDRLVSAAQWSDEETGMHIRRTGLLCEVLARAAGWFGDDVEALRQAAPMHDIGKIGIPDAILQKPGKLTAEEFAVMKTHTRIGADILAGSKSPMLQMAREIALNHHERWDGKGYPRGLAGKAIPESARIVAIVDVYDALSHDRVYRPALPEAEVLTIMQQGAGSHFDPVLMTFFFLHFSDIRRIAQEHPDDSWGGKRVFAWGGSAPAVNDATSQPVEMPGRSTGQPSIEQPSDAAVTVRSV
ncbi:MAG: CHASE domain-containing protein [Thermoguttaceae bacterium]